MASRHFRAGVVAVVERADGAILAFERADVPDSWQLPQGGIEPGEEAVDAVWRELQGGDRTRSWRRDARRASIRTGWPTSGRPRSAPVARASARCSAGSRSAWSTRHVAPQPDGSEFTAWRWVDRQWLVDNVVGLSGHGVPAGAAADDRRRRLFDDAAAERLRRQAPLAARLRPRTIDDVVGQPHLLGPGKPLRRLVETDTMSSVLFWGPPGTGKTTLALAVAGTTAKEFEQLSAVTAGVKDVRDVIERARRRLGEHDRGTILFLDEIHRFNKAQQDALLPAVEDGTLTLIGATTENPFFEVNPPLRSRSTLFRLDPLDHASLRSLAHRGLEALPGVGGRRGDRV